MADNAICAYPKSKAYKNIKNYIHSHSLLYGYDNNQCNRKRDEWTPGILLMECHPYTQRLEDKALADRDKAINITNKREVR